MDEGAFRNFTGICKSFTGLLQTLNEVIAAISYRCPKWRDLYFRIYEKQVLGLIEAVSGAISIFKASADPRSPDAS